MYYEVELRFEIYFYILSMESWYCNEKSFFCMEQFNQMPFSNLPTRRTFSYARTALLFNLNITIKLLIKFAQLIYTVT